MAYPPITELPPAPQRGDTDFSEKANAHVAALTPWTQDVNAAGAFIEQCVTAAAESRDDAAESADQAAESATAAEQARQAAESFANFKGRWSDLEGALSKPASVLEDGKVWTLLTDLADVTLSQPGVSDDWYPDPSDIFTNSTGLAQTHAIALSF